ncbi:hypothetical protein P7C73_g1539, partial [Tremellales sp. Uapishka_1]
MLSIPECDQILTAPGQLLEMEEKHIDGRTVRVWKNLAPTFRSFLIAQFEVYGTRPFIADGRNVETFAAIMEKSLTLAVWMRNRGLGMGSRIALGGGNSAGYVLGFSLKDATDEEGLEMKVVSELHCDPPYRWYRGLSECLAISKPDLILLDAERAGLLQGGRAVTKTGEMFDWSSEDFLEDLHSSPSQRARILKGAGVEELGPDSDGVIFFTSGTSGSPKAVLSTQRMALSNIFSGMVAPGRAALRAGQPIPPLPTPQDPQRAVLLAVPLFHVTGCLSWFMRACFSGSKLVIMERWNLPEAIRLIEKEQVNVIGGVPAVVAAILQSPLLPKDRRFDTVFYGGAPPSKELAKEVKQRWPAAGLVQGYGLTETNAYVCSIAGPDYMSRPDSTGPPVPICDIRIVDPESKTAVAAGQNGLLLVRGPQVMKCYLGDESATRAAIDNDGWFDTGDLGCVDEEGFLFIRDRLKDIIIRGGENIASADVENAFYADARVSEVAAIGVPDRILGERVGVIVSLRTAWEGKVQEDELLEPAKKRLAYPAWPAIILLHLGPLPRNVNGKVVKKDLKPILLDAWEKKNQVEGGRVKSKL